MKTVWTKGNDGACYTLRNTVYSSRISNNKNFQVSSTFNNCLYEQPWFNISFSLQTSWSAPFSSLVSPSQVFFPSQRIWLDKSSSSTATTQLHWIITPVQFLLKSPVPGWFPFLLILWRLPYGTGGNFNYLSPVSP